MRLAACIDHIEAGLLRVEGLLPGFNLRKDFELILIVILANTLLMYFANSPEAVHITGTALANGIFYTPYHP